MTPVFTITSNDVSSGSSSTLTSLSFTLTSNFNTTNFISSDISPSNGSISNFSGSGKTYTVTFTPSGDGACKIAVPANTFTNSDTANIVLNNKESSFSWTKISAQYEFSVHTGSNYSISGSLSSISPVSSGYNHLNKTSANVSWQTYSMGMRIQFLSAGQIVAVGAHNRYGGKISVFQLNNNTALTTVDVTGTGSTSTTPNYKYTTLSSAISVSANSTYQIIFKNTTGGYAYHNISGFVNTNSSSGNIKILGSGYINHGSTVTAPKRPTNNITSQGYGATCLIFLPS